MKLTYLLLLLLLLFKWGGVAFGHEVVGEVTPLMERTRIILLLLENNKLEDAIKETTKVIDDFPVPEKKSTETGLKATAERIDRLFGTGMYKNLARAIQERNGDALKKSLQALGLLLMLEKFDVLQSTFGKKEYSLAAQRTIFWLGRNYFSYLLEPTLAKTDPITEQALDRHLDKMLYRLEDGKYQEFVQLRPPLVEGILKAFNLALPNARAHASQGTKQP